MEKIKVDTWLTPLFLFHFALISPLFLLYAFIFSLDLLYFRSRSCNGFTPLCFLEFLFFWHWTCHKKKSRARSRCPEHSSHLWELQAYITVDIVNSDGSAGKIQIPKYLPFNNGGGHFDEGHTDSRSPRSVPFSITLDRGSVVCTYPCQFTFFPECCWVWGQPQATI